MQGNDWLVWWMLYLIESPLENGKKSESRKVHLEVLFPDWVQKNKNFSSFCVCDVNYFSLASVKYVAFQIYISVQFQPVHSTCEPPDDKTNKMTVHPVMTQISLDICQVWSKSSLCVQWVARDPSFLPMDSEVTVLTCRSSYRFSLCCTKLTIEIAVWRQKLAPINIVVYLSKFQMFSGKYGKQNLILTALETLMSNVWFSLTLDLFPRSEPWPHFQGHMFCLNFTGNFNQFKSL